MELSWITQPENVRDAEVLAQANLLKISSDFLGGYIHRPDFGQHVKDAYHNDDYSLQYDIWLDRSGYFFYIAVTVEDKKNNDTAYASGCIPNQYIK